MFYNRNSFQNLKLQDYKVKLAGCLSVLECFNLKNKNSNSYI